LPIFHKYANVVPNTIMPTTMLIHLYIHYYYSDILLPMFNAAGVDISVNYYFDKFYGLC
jgi:hypothetical protein